MWMPLTLCTPCGQYFGLITIEQKQLIDSEFTEECMLMNPNKFIAMVQSMTLENRFDSFIHLKRLSCGSDDAGDRIMSFIVSIVSLEIHTRLSENNHNVVKSDFDSHQLVEMMDINVQDPYVEGTVVFRGQVFPRVCRFWYE